ncbi:hypothetical protein OC835_002081 [Tilletia horrida]|nr:hypothetical protein OC835_002081 [Tilletia horrida]
MEHCWLQRALALTVAVTVAAVVLTVPQTQAAAVAPPAAMQQHPDRHTPRALLDLVPPQPHPHPHPPERRHMRPLSPDALLLVDQTRVSRRALQAARQLGDGESADRIVATAAVAANATNSTSNSALNPSDKLSQLGFLGNAYNAALNLSSNATGGSQLVFVQLDTGSADLWVVSTRCSKSISPACASNDIFRFDESKSKSFAPLLLGSSGGAAMNASSNVTASISATATSALLSALKPTSTIAARSERERERGSPSRRRAEDTASSKQRRWASLLRLSGIGSARNSAAPSSGRDIDAVRVAASSTASSSNGSTVPFSISYADDTVASGIIGVEDITFAELQAPRQAFGLVDQTNVTLLRQGIAGVLGLGFPRGSAISRALVGQNLTDAAISNSSSSPPSTLPLMTTLLASSGSNSSYPLFSLALNSTGGRMSIGAVDPYILPTAKDRALVDWHDVGSVMSVIPFPYGDAAEPANATANVDGAALGPYVYWAVPLAVAGVNGTSANITSPAASPYANYTGISPLAIIDSGTRGILGPVAAVADLYSHIPSSRHVGNGQWVVPCDTTVKIHFGFGASASDVVRNVTLLPTQYLIGPASGNPNLCFSWLAASLDLPSADGVGWTFGIAFFQAAYTIFSLGIAGKEAPKLGFYPMDTSLANITAASPATALASSAAATLFAPQPSESVASWLSHNATTIASTLPNSLVPLPTYPDYYMTPTYAFASATSSPTPGAVPAAGSGAGSAAGRPSYTPVITAAIGNSRIPVIANSTVQPIPSNPAAAAAAADKGAAPCSLRRKAALMLGMWSVAVLSLYFSFF